MTESTLDGGCSPRVRREIVTLLAEAGEVDLGTIYRCLMDLLGKEVVTDIGVVLSRLVRDGTISIDTARPDPLGPLVGHVRLVRQDASHLGRVA